MTHRKTKKSICRRWDLNPDLQFARSMLVPNCYQENVVRVGQFYEINANDDCVNVIKSKFDIFISFFNRKKKEFVSEIFENIRFYLSVLISLRRKKDSHLVL